MGQGVSASLIQPEELSDLLGSATPPVVLDVRWRLNTPSRYPEYLASHVPGARWCDLETDLADPPGIRGRHPLPDPTRLQVRFAQWGIHPRSSVVVYDLDDSVAAARAWWVLRWAGLDNVRVLDGGWAAWLAFGGPQSPDLPTSGGGTASVVPDSIDSLSADDVEWLAGNGTLIDVRAPERFRGELEPIDPVAGHIPGAVNLPTTLNVTASGTFLPPAELAQRFAGLSDRGPIAIYCGSGVTAAHTVLALHELGIDAALYPGSWSEWITDPEHPISTGE